jgi:hypothetical protein
MNFDVDYCKGRSIPTIENRRKRIGEKIKIKRAEFDGCNHHKTCSWLRKFK